MEVRYKVPLIGGVVDYLAALTTTPVIKQLEWYLKGLSDAGAIRNFDFERPAKGSKPPGHAWSYAVLKLDFLDGGRIEQIDSTLRESYHAELEPIPQPA